MTIVKAPLQAYRNPTKNGIVARKRPQLRKPPLWGWFKESAGGCVCAGLSSDRAMKRAGKL